MASVAFPNSNETDIDTLLELYPDDIAAGSPFNTGDANAITPEYKRLAAVLGDIAFQVTYFMDLPSSWFR